MSHQSRPTGVNTDDVVFICPTGHQALYVGLLQGVVESLFGVVR
jgi:hypothetical protein